MISTCVLAQSLSCVQVFAILWTIGHQASVSMEFSSKEYWSGLPFPTLWYLPHSGIKPTFLVSPTLVLQFQSEFGNKEFMIWATVRVLQRECTGHSKHPLPTTQEKTLHMDITRWSIPKSDWLYSLQPKMEKGTTSKVLCCFLQSGLKCLFKVYTEYIPHLKWKCLVLRKGH